MTTMPKRVAGGVVVMAKKKKKQQQQQRIVNASAAPVIRDGSISAANDNIGTDPSSSASTSHRCQSSAPSQIIRRDDELPANANDDNNNHEFDDADADNEVLDASDIPNDALLCLQAYTRPMNSETCAYVPIFTKQLLSSIESSSAASGQTRPEILEDDDDIDEFNNNNAGGKSMDVVEKSTHAAPILPKLVLLYHLVNTASSSSSSSSISTSASSRAHAERAITQLALSNDVRLLQLHGTAISTSLSSTSSWWRGDGNDDDDIVVMETSVYVDAAQMALQTYYFGQHSTLPCNDDAHRRHQSTTPATATSTMNTMDKEATIFQWFTNVLLPYFAGRTWFSSSALNSLFHHQHHYCQNPPQYCTANDDHAQMTKKRKYNHTSNDLPSGNNGSTRQGMHNTTNHRQHYTYSLKQMEQMIQQLVHAGLLLPRRRCGDCADDDDGYWFSLPGLGKAAKSIVDGRTNLLRRLQASRYKEKKRSVLEHDINERGRRQRTALNNTSGGKGNKNVVEQTGKFIVLDLLSKGWIRIHETNSTREQFVRLS